MIVVDNASRDDLGRLRSETLPSLKLLCSSTNLGFAGANNLGFEHSEGDKLLFLNPDTLVLGDAIQLKWCWRSILMWKSVSSDAGF